MKFGIYIVKPFLNLLTIVIILSILSLTITFSTFESRLKKSNKNSSLEIRTKAINSDLKRLSLLSNPISKKFDLQTAKNFRDFAGLGYVNTDSATEQLLEIETAEEIDNTKVSNLFNVLFGIQNWEHIATKTYGDDDDNYCFTIIRHLKYKKMIFSFTGTKTNYQLFKQFYQSSYGSVYSFKKPYIKIMLYFSKMYRKIETDLKNLYNEYKHPDITQYIFTGHSLGGAIASVALFDFMEENLIQKTHISPVLITYGQPRTGNYAFANELVKKVSILFRFYNNNDIVTSGPACNVKNGRCFSEFGKIKLDKKFNDYEGNYNNLGKFKFYPFHFSGGIFIKGDTKDKIINCTSKSEVDSNDKCKADISTNSDFHTIYFGRHVSKIGNPKEYPSGVNSGKQDIKLFNNKNENSFLTKTKNYIDSSLKKLFGKFKLFHTKKYKKF
jgi:hypothetical protein